MKSSEILRAARLRIESGEEKYICHAVAEAGAPPHEHYRLQRRIQGLLNPNMTLEGWLQRVHGVRYPGQPEHFKAMKRYRDRMRITRMAWIDHMVAEFEAKGD